MMRLRQAGIGLWLALVACDGSSTSTSRLQIAVVGNGSTLPPAGSYTYATGTTVRVSAVPANGAMFVGWTDAAASSASPVDVVVVGEKSLVAHFSGGEGGASSSSSGGGSSSSGSSSSSGGGSSSSGSSSSSGGVSSSSGGTDPAVSIGAGSTTASGAFVADAYYSGGNTSSTTHPIDTSLLTDAVPPAAVLQHERWGNVTYTIPNRTPGSPQTVTLYFAENARTAVGQRTFDVVLNGTKALAAFDIFAAAGGMYRAVARSFDTTADASGNVVIQFTGVTGDAKVDGITVAAGTSPRRSLTVSEAGTGRGAVMGRGVDCGPVCTATYTFDASVTVTASAASGSTFAGWSGACTGTAPGCTVSMTTDQAVTATFTGGPGDPAVSINANGMRTGTFLADAYYSGGNFWATGSAIDLSLLSGEVPPAAVFRTERWGAFTYTIPDRTPSSPQRVILYFAESAMTAAGQRTFDVAVNGTRVLTAFDIFVAAGGMNRAIARSFDATANASGQVVIEFIDGAADHAKVNALTVVGR